MIENLVYHQHPDMLLDYLGFGNWNPWVPTPIHHLDPQLCCFVFEQKLLDIGPKYGQNLSDLCNNQKEMRFLMKSHLKKDFHVSFKI